MGYIEYNVNHDLKWLKEIITAATPENPELDYDKGYKKAMGFVMELITQGMEAGDGDISGRG